MHRYTKHKADFRVSFFFVHDEDDDDEMREEKTNFPKGIKVHRARKRKLVLVWKTDIRKDDARI